MTPREIRRLRGSLGLTQVQFGALLRAHPTTVSRWEAQQVIVPDAWQLQIMEAMAVGYARRPSAADDAVLFLEAGKVALALGVLLGAAVTSEPTRPAEDL